MQVRPQETIGCALYRDRVTAIISGGNFLGRALTHDQLSHMTPDEINTLYA